MRLPRLFPRFEPRPEHRPLGVSASGAAVRIRWLGTAGHAIETDTTTVLVDPFFTRPSLLETALTKLASSEAAWRDRLPTKVDAVLLGHSHYDHLLDAPAIAKATGALVVGSATTASFARAEGVPEAQLRVIPYTGGELVVGDFRIRFVPSLHGRLALGRVPLPGMVLAPPPLPARFFHYRMGGAFGIWLEARGRSVYHNGSADLVDAELEGLRADVLLVGLAGRRATRDYLGRLTSHLEPSVVFPTHHDAFFAPLDDGVRLLPGIDLDGFFSEMRVLAPRTRIVTPLYDDVASLPPHGDAREVVLHPGDARPTRNTSTPTER